MKNTLLAVSVALVGAALVGGNAVQAQTVSQDYLSPDSNNDNALDSTNSNSTGVSTFNPALSNAQQGLSNTFNEATDIENDNDQTTLVMGDLPSNPNAAWQGAIGIGDLQHTISCPSPSGGGGIGLFGFGAQFTYNTAGLPERCLAALDHQQRIVDTHLGLEAAARSNTSAIAVIDDAQIVQALQHYPGYDATAARAAIAYEQVQEVNTPEADLSNYAASYENVQDLLDKVRTSNQEVTGETESSDSDYVYGGG